jgi:hypothetical protein
MFNILFSRLSIWSAVYILTSSVVQLIYAHSECSVTINTRWLPGWQAHTGAWEEWCHLTGISTRSLRLLSHEHSETDNFYHTGGSWRWKETPDMKEAQSRLWHVSLQSINTSFFSPYYTMMLEENMLYETLKYSSLTKN